MYEKVLILFCAAAAVIAHEIDITTPTPVTSSVEALPSGPEITSYSSPPTVTNTYLPVPDPTEVKIGAQYKSPSALYRGSSYVPVHVGPSAYQPSSLYGRSWNFGSTTQATPLYTTAAPIYSTTPASFPSGSSYSKYPSASSYVKSTIAPSYRYSISSIPGSQAASYPSYSQTYTRPVAKSSYVQPLSHYHAGIPTIAPASYSVSPASYSTYPQSYASYPSSTLAPTLVSSTLGYGSSSALPYSVSPTVASYSTPSPSYLIQPAPLKAQFSYAGPSVSYPAQQVAYGSQPLVQTVGAPYQVGQGVQYVSEPQYSSYAVPHGGSVAYSSFPVVSNVNYAHGYNHGWKK